MAEGGQAAQAFRIPEYAGRVVGVRKYEQAALFVADCLEVFEIHRIAAVCVLYERVVHDFATVALGYETERMIDRRLDYNLLVRLQEGIDNHSYTLHYAGDVTEPFPLHLPSVMLQYPLLNHRPVVGRLYRVAEYGMLQTLAQGLDNERRGFEVHIRNPEGQEIRLAVAGLERVGLEGACPPSLYLSVEIVFHHISIY